MDKQGFRLVLVLTIICIIAGAVLAFVNSVTEPKIKAQEALAMKKALQETLPEASEFQPDESLLKEAQQAGGTDLSELFIGFKGEEKIGVVLIADLRGYSSVIRLVTGVSRDGRVMGVKVLSQSETPGLGNKISEKEFIEQPALQQATIEEQLSVIKDGGSVQAVTGATISSRAVVKGVNQSLAAARLFMQKD
jgi:electron transport complex protein RnfG